MNFKFGESGTFELKTSAMDLIGKDCPSTDNGRAHELKT